MPWVGPNHAERTRNALEELLKQLPDSGLVWGGDWNHGLDGHESAGSKAGRDHIVKAVSKLGLKVPTKYLCHRLPELRTIDHIAVGTGVEVVSAERIEAIEGSRRLSDHDAYVVEIR